MLVPNSRTRNLISQSPQNSPKSPKRKNVRYILSLNQNYPLNNFNKITNNEIYQFQIKLYDNLMLEEIAVFNTAEAIKYVQIQTKKMCDFIIAQHPKNIKYINNKSYELCLKCIQQDPTTMVYMTDTEYWNNSEFALELTSKTIRNIIISFGQSNDIDDLLRLIMFLENIDKKHYNNIIGGIRKKIILIDPFKIQTFKNPSYALKKLAYRKNKNIIAHIQQTKKNLKLWKHAIYTFQTKDLNNVINMIDIVETHSQILRKLVLKNPNVFTSKSMSCEEFKICIKHNPFVAFHNNSFFGEKIDELLSSVNKTNYFNGFLNARNKNDIIADYHNLLETPIGNIIKPYISKGLIEKYSYMNIDCYDYLMNQSNDKQIDSDSSDKSNNEECYTTDSDDSDYTIEKHMIEKHMIENRMIEKHIIEKNIFECMGIRAILSDDTKIIIFCNMSVLSVEIFSNDGRYVFNFDINGNYMEQELNCANDELYNSSFDMDGNYAEQELNCLYNELYDALKNELFEMFKYCIPIKVRDIIEKNYEKQKKIFKICGCDFEPLSEILFLENHNILLSCYGDIYSGAMSQIIKSNTDQIVRSMLSFNDTISKYHISNLTKNKIIMDQLIYCLIEKYGITIDDWMELLTNIYIDFHKSSDAVTLNTSNFDMHATNHTKNKKHIVVDKDVVLENIFGDIIFRYMFVSDVIPIELMTYEIKKMAIMNNPFEICHVSYDEQNYELCELIANKIIKTFADINLTYQQIIYLVANMKYCQNEIIKNIPYFELFASIYCNSVQYYMKNNEHYDFMHRNSACVIKNNEFYETMRDKKNLLGKMSTMINDQKTYEYLLNFTNDNLSLVLIPKNEHLNNDMIKYIEIMQYISHCDTGFSEQVRLEPFLFQMLIHIEAKYNGDIESYKNDEVINYNCVKEYYDNCAKEHYEHDNIKMAYVRQKINS